MKTEKTNAIVLRRTNYGEADRIIQVLTPVGKRSLIAKGSRKEKSRLAGGIELFATCAIVIMKGKGEVDTLVSSRLSHFYRHIVEDFDRMQFAYQAIKLVSQASETTDGKDWYEVMVETLAGLDAKSLDLRLVQMWFLARYAKLLGYELNLWNDSSGLKIKEEETYNYDVSDKSFIKNQNGNIDSRHIKLLRLVATKPLKVIAQVGGIDDILDECLMIVRQHVSI